MMKVFKNFIDSEDLIVLKNWCEKSVEDNRFYNGPIDRYFLRLRKDFPESWEGKDITDGHFRKKTYSLSNKLVIPECIDAIEEKLIKRFKIPCTEKPDVFMSLHKEGGEINRHRHFPKDGFCDLRFNMFINKTDGGDPVVNDILVKVDSGDLIIFSGNNFHHTTKIISGNRIILSYGFFVELDFLSKIFLPKL